MSEKKHLVQFVFPDKEEAKNPLLKFLDKFRPGESVEKEFVVDGSLAEGLRKGTVRLLVYTMDSDLPSIWNNMGEDLCGMMLGGKPKKYNEEILDLKVAAA
jgi:hypothetical protein